MIQQYINELLEINKEINLTRITDPKDVQLLHIEDSLQIIPEINEAPEGLYGDMGSGGGIPGVPVAISTGRQTILIDSVKKKMTAVQNILEKLKLNNQISTYGGRLEELALEQPNQFSVLTARAVSKLSSLMELASPLLKKNGLLICLKSHIDQEELDNALKVQNKLGMNLIKQRDYYLSDNKTYRTVIVFQKINDPKIKLPRKNGAAQKNPL